jgi:maleylpyruvate isomerase
MMARNPANAGTRTGPASLRAGARTGPARGGGPGRPPPDLRSPVRPESAGPSIAPDLAAVRDSTARLLATVATLTDAQAAAAARLPGWTRGHVLSHLARNADGLRNLLRWAATGQETPMYPSEAARDAAIDDGAARPAASLAVDVRRSAAAFETAAAALPAAAWAARVARRGQWFPARQILTMRRSELEIHHVDLGLGYEPGDWPAGFTRAALGRVAAGLAGRADFPALLARPDGLAPFPAGPAGPGGEPPGMAVSGPPAVLLAWLTGRGDGTGLQVTGAGALPPLPPWR